MILYFIILYYTILYYTIPYHNLYTALKPTENAHALDLDQGRAVYKLVVSLCVTYIS